MLNITNEALIEKAAALVNPKKNGVYVVGDVGCALLSEQGNLYLGVCMDVSSGIGFCAEHSAIAAMVTAGEYRIARIVAIWKDEKNDIYVLSPCGRCREFMRQIDPRNLDTQVILDTNHVAKLSDLLPYHDWFNKIQGNV